MEIYDDGDLPRYFPETFEKPSRYCPGGFHPVSMGDVFDNRYHVLHRLGHGTFSTVWLVEDKLATPRYKALKIFAADAKPENYRVKFTDTPPQPAERTWSVRAVLSQAAAFLSFGRYRNTEPECPGAEYIVKLHSQFTIHGPNGIHHAHTLDFVGPTLSGLLQSHSVTLSCLPSDNLLEHVYQIAAAISFMHSKGIVHADKSPSLRIGFRLTPWTNLHPGNVAFGLPTLDSISVEELLACIGQPVTVPSFMVRDGEIFDPEDPDCPPPPLIPDPHKPLHFFVPPAVGALWDLSLGNIPTGSFLPTVPGIRIFDFSESFSSPGCRVPGIPLNYCAPEILLSDGLPDLNMTFAIDIWAFACLAYELLAGKTLFGCTWGTRRGVLKNILSTVRGNPCNSIPDEHLQYYLQVLGLDALDSLQIKRSEADSLEAKIHSLGLIDHTAQKTLINTLHRALLLDPTRRSTADDILSMISDKWKKIPRSGTS